MFWDTKITCIIGLGTTDNECNAINRKYSHDRNYHMTTTAFISSVYQEKMGIFWVETKFWIRRNENTMKILIYSLCALCKICIRGKCIWPIFELLVVCFDKHGSFRCIYEKAKTILEHTITFAYIHYICLFFSYGICLSLSSLRSLVQSRKKIRVLEKSPLFARWKNKAKLAVITSLGCIMMLEYTTSIDYSMYVLKSNRNGCIKTWARFEIS